MSNDNSTIMSVCFICLFYSVSVSVCVYHAEWWDPRQQGQSPSRAGKWTEWGTMASQSGLIRLPLTPVERLGKWEGLILAWTKNMFKTCLSSSFCPADFTGCLNEFSFHETCILMFSTALKKLSGSVWRLECTKLVSPLLNSSTTKEMLTSDH